MEGKVISRLLSEVNAVFTLGQNVYHPLWGFGKVTDVEGTYKVFVTFLKKDTPNIDIAGPSSYLSVLLRTIVFRQRYIHGSKQPVKDYPVPVRFWEQARNKGWLDHPKIIEADIIDGVAILFGTCNVGCS